MKQTKKEKSFSELSKVDQYLATVGIAEEKEYFLENLAMLIQSGIAMNTALEAIRQETKSRGMKMILASIITDLEAGEPLWRALDRVRILEDNAISLIKLGEESGQLSENLNVIILRERRDRSFRGKIRGAMMYPVFVLVLAFVIGVGISWFMLPRLAKVFADLKLDLPLMTRMLIGLGKFIEDYGKIFIPTLVIAVLLLIYIFFVNKKTKFLGEGLILLSPGIRKVLQGIELSRFGYVLGTLLRAGLPLPNALHALSTSGGVSVFQKLYREMEESIQEGNSFQKTFAANKKFSKLLPLPQQQMIAAAEQSGKLEDVLLQMGEIFEEKTDMATKNIAVLLEPLMLVIVWLAVVFVALAVVLPIYSLVGGLSNNGDVRQTGSANEQQAEQPIIEMTENVENAENAGVSEASEVIIITEESIQTTQAEVTQEDIPEPEKQLDEIIILETETGTLNVREKPSIKSKIITKVKPGEKFMLLEANDEWMRIQLTDKEGWIAKQYAQIVEEKENQL